MRPVQILINFSKKILNAGHRLGRYLRANMVKPYPRGLSRACRRTSEWTGVGAADGVLFEGFRLDRRGGVLFRLDRPLSTQSGRSCRPTAMGAVAPYPPFQHRRRTAQLSGGERTSGWCENRRNRAMPQPKSCWINALSERKLFGVPIAS